jgi:heme ABC exporter ATP-binding subunit CcmA
VVALSGRFPLLAGVDLEVGTGEVVLVEGPNGAGKTSLLRVAAGLVPVTSGRLTVLGLDPERYRTAVRRRVGMLAHASHLYDDLNVRENVRFAVRAAGADPGRIGPACERLGLTGRLLRTSAAKLSAGQRRRVALAVLVARAPDLWLLDEPHAGLDASARTLLDELIGEAVATGATVVVASHEPELLEPLADRSVTVSGGRVTGERSIRSPVADVPVPVRAVGSAAPASGPPVERVGSAEPAAGPPEGVGSAAPAAGPPEGVGSAEPAAGPPVERVAHVA